YTPQLAESVFSVTIRGSLLRCLGARGVRIRRVACRIERTHAVVVRGISIHSRVGKRRNTGSDLCNLREVRAVRILATFNPETTFIAGVIRPRQVDLRARR